MPQRRQDKPKARQKPDEGQEKLKKLDLLSSFVRLAAALIDLINR